MQDGGGLLSRGAGIFVGLLLVVVGVFFLAVNTLGYQPFDFGRVGWPIFVIAPGLALLIIGLVTGAEAGIGLAVAGGIVSTVGLVLAYQASTDHWASWESGVAGRLSPARHRRPPPRRQTARRRPRLRPTLSLRRPTTTSSSARAARVGPTTRSSARPTFAPATVTVLGNARAVGSAAWFLQIIQRHGPAFGTESAAADRFCQKPTPRTCATATTVRPADLGLNRGQKFFHVDF